MDGDRLPLRIGISPESPYRDVILYVPVALTLG